MAADEWRAQDADMRTVRGWSSLCQREISEEVEDEPVGFARCFQRDEMRGTGDFDVAGVR